MTRQLKKEYWPHRVSIGSDHRPDIELIEYWLSEHTGKFRNRWNVIYQYNRTDFYFRNETDAAFFALKWS